MLSRLSSLRDYAIFPAAILGLKSQAITCHRSAVYSSLMQGLPASKLNALR